MTEAEIYNIIAKAVFRIDLDDEDLNPIMFIRVKAACIDAVDALINAGVICIGEKK